MDAHKLVQEMKKLSMIILFSHCTTLKGMIPADYLDVDSPAHHEKKSRAKKRRKVERNTKLSRSLDSLKELHGKQNLGMLKERLKIKICLKKITQVYYVDCYSTLSSEHGIKPSSKGVIFV